MEAEVTRRGKEKTQAWLPTELMWYLYTFKWVNSYHFPEGKKDDIFFIVVFYSTVYEMYSIKGSLKEFLCLVWLFCFCFVLFFREGRVLFCFRIWGYIFKRLHMKAKHPNSGRLFAIHAVITGSDSRQHLREGIPAHLLLMSPDSEAPNSKSHWSIPPPPPPPLSQFTQNWKSRADFQISQTKGR